MSMPRAGQGRAHMFGQEDCLHIWDSVMSEIHPWVISQKVSYRDFPLSDLPSKRKFWRLL